jgi:hypothetical protein
VNLAILAIVNLSICYGARPFVILLDSTHSFCDFVSHFTRLNSIILIQWTQSFLLSCSIILWFYQPFFATVNLVIFYCELNHSINHFTTVNTNILWFCQSSCYNKLNHFDYSEPIHSGDRGREWDDAIVCHRPNRCPVPLVPTCSGKKSCRGRGKINGDRRNTHTHTKQ